MYRVENGEYKVGKYTIYVDEEFNAGLFDMDEKGEVSKVLKLFGTNSKGDDTLRFSRFPYSKTNKYRLAREEDLLLYGCEYFDEDGNRPLKLKKCDDTCVYCKSDVCFMTDDKIKVYKANLEPENYKCNEYYENGIPQ